MEILKSRIISSFTISLYLLKFSGLICFLISSSETPPSRISAIIAANFSRAWPVTRVSGTSTFITLAKPSPMALFRAPAYSFASSWSIAFFNSSIKESAVNPALTLAANSSVRSGTDRDEALRTSTSKMACLPAKVLSRSLSGKLTETCRVSPTLAPTSPSTSPSMYRPGPKTTSTLSPEAAFGNGSPFSPSAVAMYPTILTLQASPICSAYS
mmetsp:Transcript_16374/g.35893  ORF Transcript_16374/g.35893 Transcript_16374/m.35893 type:complete len:213 (+) Transcript_16374:2033-2671(+)